MISSGLLAEPECDRLIGVVQLALADVFLNGATETMEGDARHDDPNKERLSNHLKSFLTIIL